MSKMDLVYLHFNVLVPRENVNKIDSLEREEDENLKSPAVWKSGEKDSISEGKR